MNNTNIQTNASQTILSASNLTVYYGNLKALENVSFKIDKNEIVAMIGPNGAGKSTALKAVSGLLAATDGQIENGTIIFDGHNVRGLRTDELVFKGMSLVPEGRRVFPSMTVRENLEMGAFTLSGGQKSAINDRMSEVFSLFPVLSKKCSQKAGTLSGGEQQMLAIGRALMLRPKLLLADEPSLGLSPNYVDLIFDKLIEINKQGISILLVEQNVQMALEVCHRGYVFEVGSIALEGTKNFLIENDKIKDVYLGIGN